MIQPSQSVRFLMKWGCKGHWGHGGCWGCRGHWGCRGSKVWKIITEDFRVIQVLEFSFILMFWKNIFLFESWNIMLNFSNFSARGCWGQPMSLFQKLITETQISNPPEPAMDHNSIKLMTLLPFIAIYFRSFRYETPCTVSIKRPDCDLRPNETNFSNTFARFPS